MEILGFQLKDFGSVASIANVFIIPAVGYIINLVRKIDRKPDSETVLQAIKDEGEAIKKHVSENFVSKIEFKKSRRPIRRSNNVQKEPRSFDR